MTKEQMIKGLHAIKICYESAIKEHYPSLMEQTENQLECLDEVIEYLENNSVLEDIKAEIDTMANIYAKNNSSAMEFGFYGGLEFALGVINKHISGKKTQFQRINVSTYRTCKNCLASGCDTCELEPTGWLYDEKEK